MRKIIVLLYFLVATVTGQMQNNAQDQLVRINMPSPVEQALAFRDAYSGITRRKPCQKRRKIETLDGKPPVGGGSVTTLHSKSIYPIDNKVIDHKITREVNNYEPLKPQSLKESKAISPLEIKGQIHEIPVENQAPVPSVNVNEHKPIQDQSKTDSIEDSNDSLCQGDAEDDLARLEKQKINKQEEIHKQAIKLVTKCVQDAKTETSSRRTMSNSAPLSDISSSSGFNVPVNDDNADVNARDSLRSNNDHDASQPNMGFLRTNPAAVAENQDPAEMDARKSRDDLLVELQHPTIGNFITNVTDTNVSLLKNARVCYACSSVNDPTCWHPGKFTTLKYCKKGHDKCISKTIQTSAKSELIMIRDCGSTCNDNSMSGVLPRYKSCRLCDADLCNSAVSLDSLNMLLVTFLMAAFKYAL